jgi:hypothetical protein
MSTCPTWCYLHDHLPMAWIYRHCSRIYWHITVRATWEQAERKRLTRLDTP